MRQREEERKKQYIQILSRLETRMRGCRGGWTLTGL